jgi:hypothetical protein
MKISPAVVTVLALTLLFSACAPKGEAESPGDAVQEAAGDASVSPPPAASGLNLSNALNLVTGTPDAPSVFPSYHLEISLDGPALSDDWESVVQEARGLKANVEGDKVYVDFSNQGQPFKEGYLIGEDEYLVKDGIAQPAAVGEISLPWAFWPLDVVPIFAASVIVSEKTGTDTVNGRKADVYAVDTAANPAQLATLVSMGLAYQSFKGTIWIDQETGGLLKTAMDFSMDVYNNDLSKVLGSGVGRLDLEVSNIGSTSVNLP